MKIEVDVPELVLDNIKKQYFEFYKSGLKTLCNRDMDFERYVTFLINWRIGYGNALADTADFLNEAMKRNLIREGKYNEQI